jgi:geranylgeranyl diphosphate synthase type II
MHEFQKTLDDYKKRVWPEIKHYLDFNIESISNLEDEKAQEYHLKLCADYPQRGGKYFRPTLLLLTAEALGGTIQKAIKTAAAMEISEDWLLIHDDFEDHSLHRRGEPTLHRRYSPELAINAGDTLQILMWRILRENESLLGAATTFRIMDEFYRMLMRTAFGQTTEIYHIQNNDCDLTEDDGYFIIDGKTSYYTIAGPMRLGAIIAVEDKDKLERQIFPTLNEFGRCLGRAFQLIDDVLDLTSDFKGLKKQRGNDIYEGKRSIILIHLLNNANPPDRKQLLEFLNKSRESKTQEEVDHIIHLMDKYESIQYARAQANKLAAQAKSILAEVNFFCNAEAEKKLKLSIDFVTERLY